MKKKKKKKKEKAAHTWFGLTANANSSVTETHSVKDKREMTAWTTDTCTYNCACSYKPSVNCKVMTKPCIYMYGTNK